MCSGSYDYYPTNKLPAPYPALNDTAIAAFCEGEAAVVTAAQQWLIANGGFDYNCFDFITGGALPSVNDTAAQCAAKVTALDHASPKAAAVVLYGDRTNSKLGYNDATASQAVAVFMLVRGPKWFMGVPSANVLNATTGALLLTDYGAPKANMTVAGNVFSRAYAGAIVSLDCNTFKATFTAK
jgi:hypothetical protein